MPNQRPYAKFKRGFNKRRGHHQVLAVAIDTALINSCVFAEMEGIKIFVIGYQVMQIPFRRDAKCKE
jgi:hypothetical protein